MAIRVIWSPKAVNSMEEICNYIEKDSPYFAKLFAKRVFKLIQGLAEFPLSGRIVSRNSCPLSRFKIVAIMI